MYEEKEDRGIDDTVLGRLLTVRAVVGLAGVGAKQLARRNTVCATALSTCRYHSPVSVSSYYR